MVHIRFFLGLLGLISSVSFTALWTVPIMAQEADLYLAPNGNDQWSGRLAAPNAEQTDGPLASFPAAQQVVRSMRESQPERNRPITVAIRGGTYWLDQPIAFGPEDSGTATSPTIYQAFGDERPIFSGGRQLTGWQINEQGAWELDLPEVAAGDWSFVQLFVNDQRRYRPRMPKKGYYQIVSAQDPSPKAAGKGHDRFGFAAGQIDSSWTNLQDVEVIAFHSWTASRMPIVSVDDTDHVVTLGGNTAGFSWWAQFQPGHRFLVANVREALQQPGEWYLDRKKGELTYLPHPDESPDQAVVVAPRLRYLVLFKGDVAQRRWVEYLELRGLTFAHSNWVTPPEGQSFPQAEINLGAAVAAEAARNLVLDRCAVRHTGEYGVAFGPGCQHNRVENCELVDLGAGGIKIGNALPTEWGNTLGAPEDQAAVVSHHTIRNCLIAHGGRLHSAGIGVWIGHSPYNVIQHNDVFDFYYSAFSIGWVWGYGPSLAHHNDLGFNHAHTIGQGVLSDMGCIYTLGISPGTVIHDNHFHDVVSYDYGGWGLYTDEGSTGVVMRNNLVYRCSRGGFHQHYGRENRIENNIFAYGGEHQLQRTRTEDHISFYFQHNIVLWDNDSPLLGSNWKDNNFRLDHNLYWHGGKPVVFPGDLTLEQWQKERNQDVHSRIADPQFADAPQGDFHLADDSPAYQIGFQPFDYTQAGRKTPIELTKDLPPVPRGFD